MKTLRDDGGVPVNWKVKHVFFSKESEELCLTAMRLAENKLVDWQAVRTANLELLMDHAPALEGECLQRCIGSMRNIAAQIEHPPARKEWEKEIHALASILLRGFRS